MTDPANATQVTPEQAIQGTQVQPEQGQIQAAPLAPQSTQQPAEPTTPQQPSVAELQQRLADMEARTKQLDESVRYHQSQASKFQSAAQAALGGQNPNQPDELSRYLKPYLDRGIDKDDAVFLAQRDMQTDQRFNSLQNALVGTQQVPGAISAAIGQNIALQSVGPQIHSYIQGEVAKGNMEALNPEFIKTIGARFYLDSMQNQKPQAAPAVPQFNTQFGPLNGYQPQPVQQTSNQIPEHIRQAQQAERAQVASIFNFQPKPAA